MALRIYLFVFCSLLLVTLGTSFNMKYVMNRLSSLEMKLETEIKRRRLETETFEAENKQRRSETEELFRMISELTKDKMLNKNEHVPSDEISTSVKNSTTVSPPVDKLKTTDLALNLSYLVKGAAIEKRENLKLRSELKNISKHLEIGIIMSESRINEKIRNFTNYVSDKQSSLVTVERFNNLSNLVTKISTTSLSQLRGETRHPLRSMKFDIEASMSDMRRETRQSLSSVKLDIEASMSDLRRETRQSLSSMKFDIEASIRELSSSLLKMNQTISKIRIMKRVVKINNFSSSLPLTTLLPNTMKSKPTETPISLKPMRPTSCKSASDRNGVLFIYPETLQNPIKVYCDQSTDGGGWLIIQRRKDGSVDFELTWADYKAGFGNPEGEFWIGNDNLYALTSAKLNELRIELEDFEGNKAYAKYSNFKIHPESKLYRLEVSGYSGNAYDSLTWHNGMEFSTKDRDNDKWDDGSCSLFSRGAWWYQYCGGSNLNGFYYHGGNSTDRKGIYWHYWKGSYYSLKTVEMKIR